MILSSFHNTICWKHFLYVFWCLLFKCILFGTFWDSWILFYELFLRMWKLINVISSTKMSTLFLLFEISTIYTVFLLILMHEFLTFASMLLILFLILYGIFFLQSFLFLNTLMWFSILANLLIIPFIMYMFCLLLLLCHITPDCSELILALCLRITPGGEWEIICNIWDQTQVGCKVSILPTVLSGPIIILLLLLLLFF